MLCGVQPTCVDKNALFVADLEKLKDPKDVRCDVMGSWRLNGTHPVYLYFTSLWPLLLAYGPAMRGNNAALNFKSGRLGKLI